MMHAFQPQELQQLYQVELILRLEAPDLGLDTSHIDRYEALFAGKRNCHVGVLGAKIGLCTGSYTGVKVSDLVGVHMMDGYMDGHMDGKTDRCEEERVIDFNAFAT